MKKSQYLYVLDFKIIPTNPSRKHLWHHVNFIVLPLFRGSTQEAQCSTRDPTSSHDLRKWEWSTHCDGQHATERGEQTAAGHREAPGPHTCYRGVCHTGGSGAISCVCKCKIPASLEARRDKQALSQRARGVKACGGLSAGWRQPLLLPVMTAHSFCLIQPLIIPDTSWGRADGCRFVSNELHVAAFQGV